MMMMMTMFTIYIAQLSNCYAARALYTVTNEILRTVMCLNVV